VGNTTKHLRHMPKRSAKKRKRKNQKRKRESPPPNTNDRALGPWCTELSRPTHAGAPASAYIYPTNGSDAPTLASHPPGPPSLLQRPISHSPPSPLPCPLPPRPPRALATSPAPSTSRARLYKVRLPPLFRPLRSRLRKGLEFCEPR
jgi:hypothetical protein